METFGNLKQFRNNYIEIKNRLPWLDSCFWQKEKIDFSKYAHSINIPYIRSFELHSGLRGKLKKLKEEHAFILRYNPQNGPLKSFNTIYSE
jgi:hypothetical protein